jgi:hypothetical protein
VGTTFLKAFSAPFSVSSASASLAASMKRLDCSGSSGLELDDPLLLVPALFTFPAIDPPLIGPTTSQAPRIFKAHCSLAAFGASVRRLLFKRRLKFGNAGLQGSNALTQNEKVGCTVLRGKPRPPKNTNLDGARHV